MKKAAGIAVLALVFLLSGCGIVSGFVRVAKGTPVPVETATPETAAAPETTTTTEASASAPEPIDSPEPAQTPEATAEPTRPPKPAASQVTVACNEGTVTIAGLDASGGEMWKREIKIEAETELTPYSEAVIDGGAAYLQVDYHMTALDIATGDTLWSSELDGGFCTPVVTGGKVYTCSYYGSPLDIFDEASGAQLFEALPFDDTFFWPYKVELTDGKLLVSFGHAGGEDSEGTATFGLDGSFIEKKAQ